MLQNMPTVTMGVVAVSRDCFPIELSRVRLQKLVAACAESELAIIPCQTIIQSEADAMAAVAEMRAKGVNAVTIYLGNFGPEGPTTIFARELGVPFMLTAAAEETKHNLIDGRGDAFCGMLNASLNCGLRNLNAYIPPMPVGSASEVASMIAHFSAVARVLLGMQSLKIFSFGPRPHDFYACNAPIKPLYDLGIEVMENSELDMFQLYNNAGGSDSEIDAIAKDMAKELGAGNNYPQKLRQLAQFELALTRFFEANLGSRQFGVFANKCWPAFESAFGFVPCYVNSRLAARGIPAACEVDLYGAVSEYICQLASQSPATLLDINNTVPADLEIADLKGATRPDLFMGFHCGNTPCCCLNSDCAMKYQLIMHRLMEPDQAPNLTCGTLEGTLKPGATTLLRVQSTGDCKLQAYLAEGEILDADPCSFGSIGIFAIPNFARFYRYVMLDKQFPHHGAVAFEHIGRIAYDALLMLGMPEVWTPRSAQCLYQNENPF